ncbi:hypothetical protein OOK31_20215 [Streptomyces sp. NBC_00249]|uniref:hypothetical protein n=1 Tax=Streptomyces sp. NBC_00249 TaxID=2975690 RepID=UPI002255F531|nr:hypothetical protein [Streptomyces sp. NBC_00249]MCX5196195.1 hypothetical protein [Streptomyces sp. NBC_00249]
MTQRLRAPHWTAGAALAAAALLATAPANAVPGRTPDPAAPVRAVVVADVPEEAYEELAGSAAGVGRERPGRPPGERADPELAVASRPLRPMPPQRPRREPAAAASSAPAVAPSRPAPVSALGTEPNDRAADLAAHILPLGTGLALMGVGLGYMGMRLRRGR